MDTWLDDKIGIIQTEELLMIWKVGIIMHRIRLRINSNIFEFIVTIHFGNNPQKKKKNEKNSSRVPTSN